MDIDETRQAYERATQMDIGTARDMIEDLQIEREQLLRQIARLERKLKTWRGIADKVFTFNTGCLPGCRKALMCSCGFEHYRAEHNAELAEAHKND